MLRTYSDGPTVVEAEWPARSSAIFRNATVGRPSGIGATGTNFVVWNGLMAERMSAYKVRAFAAAALPHFPKLRYSDFGCPGWNTSFCNVPTNDGSLPCLSGSGQNSFNLQAPVTYGEFQSFECVNRTDERPPEEGCAAGYGIAPILRDRFGVASFNKTDFNMMRINVLQVRQAALGGPAIKPWLAFKGFCWECTPSDYYTERVFHLALAGATDFYCARMSLRLVCESSATLTHPCLHRLLCVDGRYRRIPRKARRSFAALRCVGGAHRARRLRRPAVGCRRDAALERRFPGECSNGRLGLLLPRL